MRRLFGAAAAVVALSGPVGTEAQAATGMPPVATQVAGIAYDLPAGTSSVEMYCADSDSPGSRHFGGFAIVRPDGTTDAWALIAGSADPDRALHVRVLSTHESLELAPSTTPSPLELSVTHTGDLGGMRLHAGYAFWGSPRSCGVEVDGLPITGLFQPLPTSTALSARIDELTGGAAAVLTTPGVGAGLSLTRASHGFQMTSFGIGSTEAGALRAISPGGETRSSIGKGAWLQVLEPTDGPWTYLVDAAAGYDLHFPMLWVLDLPL